MWFGSKETFGETEPDIITNGPIPLYLYCEISYPFNLINGQKIGVSVLKYNTVTL